MYHKTQPEVFRLESLKMLIINRHLPEFNDLKEDHDKSSSKVCQHFDCCSRSYDAVKKSHLECTLKFDPREVFSFACTYNKIEVVKFLISHELYNPEFYYMCVKLASIYGHLELVKFLTTLEASNKGGAHHDAMVVAENNNHHEIVAHFKSFWPFRKRYPGLNIIMGIFGCILIASIISVVLMGYPKLSWWLLIYWLSIMMSFATLLFTLLIHLNYC